MNMPIFTIRATRRTDRSISSGISLRTAVTGLPSFSYSKRSLSVQPAAAALSRADLSAASSSGRRACATVPGSMDSWSL